MSRLCSSCHDRTSCNTHRNFNDNQIAAIGDGAFGGAAGALRLLWITNNRLTSISQYALSSLSAVQAIYLRNNAITRIATGALADLTSLKRL